MLTRRYQLQGTIGSGAMGVVHRAHDRLTGQDVALKRVLLPSSHGADEGAHELLSLAHEFRTLAGLRHPHIISVLDYGFDSERRPFYTMELLEGAPSILEAGAGLPHEARAGLLLQALEALAYLHRRGILHHDLKPANILVAGGRARLLDFGLSVVAGQQRGDDMFGTLQYMAPEVLDGRAYTAASDLYSLGVIAYELLVGRHPFPAESARAFVEAVCTAPPDMAALAGRPALAAAVGRLLAKDPGERPGSAREAIGALRAAVGRGDSGGDAAVRESYLQAAAFVGREAELATLTGALDAARRGGGSGWLIGGESGVGKSRLVEELRTQALVDGFQVLRGQALAGSGGRPYEVWREPVRQLLITTTGIDPASAAALAQLAPDVGDLLGMPAAPAPELAGEAAQLQLFHAIARLIEAQPQPVLLILEDLQWAAASLRPIPTLLRDLAHRPAMLVGTYRNDERPGLPQELPDMRPITLARLESAAITQLSSAILGEAGQRPEIVAFLQRETEGNTFFILEVIRELAASAGRLDAVGSRALPETVLPRGIQHLALRRIGRVPPGDRPLLRLAAVAGRDIDPDLLELLSGTPGDVGRWLAGCAEAAVLEVSANRWRFSHDKIREALVASIPADERPAAHRRVAAALALLYDDQPAYAATIAYHWRHADDPAQELAYAERAGDHAASQFLYGEALDWYQRANALRRPPASPAELRRQIDLVNKLAERLVGQGQAQAFALADEALAMARDGMLAGAAYHEGIADAQQTVGLMLLQSGRNAEALAVLREALARAEALGDHRRVTVIMRGIVTAHWASGDYGPAEECALHMLRSGEERGDLHAVLHSYIALAMVCEMLSRPDDEVSYEQQALQIARQLGDRAAEARTLINHSVTLGNQGRLREALGYCLEGLRVARELGMAELEVHAMLNTADIYDRLGDVGEAWRYVELCQPLVTGRGFANHEFDMLILRATLLVRLGRLPESLALIERLEEAAQRMSDPVRRRDLERLADLAREAAGGAAAPR